MRKKIGFIGCGNMATAMLAGMLKAEVCMPNDIIVSRRSESALQQLSVQYGVLTTTDNIEAANADFVVLAVKPVYYAQVIDQLKAHISDDQVIVTIAPGFELDKLTKMFGKPIKLIRTMPNTPALVGEGMTAIVCGDSVTDLERSELNRLFSAFGKTEFVEERLMDAVVAVSGSSPAYIYLFLEAMADAAVLEGMPRTQAYRFAAQAVLGSAKMLLETGKHPGELKDAVCSPGGTTIEAVKVLEQKGMRAAVMDAMHACADKCKK